MSSGRAIARNAAWLFVATTGQKLLAFLSFTIAARIVGVTVTGEYFYAIAVTSTAVILADLGMTPVVIRAISAGKEEGRRLLSAALHIKAYLIPVAVIVALGYVVLGHASPVILTTTAIACLVMSADALHLILYGALRGTQRLQFEAMGMFIGQVLTAITAVSAATLGWGAPGLAVALLIASSWNVAWAVIQTRLQGVVPLPATKHDMLSLVKQAIPFALAGIFVKVYSYLDSLMLHAFHGSDDVGKYAVAYKITYAFQFIPLVFTAALFPAMSSVYATGDKKKLRGVLAGSLRLMAIVAAPLAAGISAIAPRFVPFAFGLEFLGSIPALVVLPWVLIPIFLDFPIGSLLNATHRAHLKTGAMGATMVINALLNAILVPLYGPVGAAWAGVGSFWALMAMGMWFTWDDLPGAGWVTLLLARSGVVAAVTWFAVRIPGEIMPLPFTVLFGGAVGVCALLATSLLTIGDLKTGLQWFVRKVKGPDPIDEELHV
jgi:O-antigen/teichoic acid export membrane protein